MSRLYLSPPWVGGDEQKMVAEVIASNWIAPLGPHVDAFEREFAARAGMAHAAAVFIDSERASWNIDPDLVAEEIAAAARRGKLPKAVIVPPISLA